MKKCSKCQTIYPDSTSFCSNDGTPLMALGGLEPGTTIRRKYRIDEEIGRGGMGVVYRAWHMVFREPRALKVINTQYVNDPQFVGRFLVEAMVTHGIQHPNIVRVEDTDETETGCPFVAMEFIEGRSLRRLLDEEGPIDASRALYFASQVCAGLAAAHSLGIIHRDIKPDNILIAEAQDTEVVKILDFGIAKLKHGLGMTVPGGLTTGSMFLGTPSYASPEQARGGHDSQLDQSSDLYSLGVVLYEMLTGRPPFAGPSPMDLLLQHINEKPSDPREIWPELDLTDSTVAIVMKALQKDRPSRFASAEEMRLTLERASYTLRRRRQEMPRIRARQIDAAALKPNAANPAAPPAPKQASSVNEYIEAAQRELAAGHYTAASAWIEKARGFEEKHNEVLTLEREIGERRTRQLRENHLAKLRELVSRAATEQEVQQAQELILQTRKEFGNDPLVAELEKELAGKATALAKRPMPIPAAEMSTFSRICLSCGAPNPPENSHCLKCDQLFQESIKPSSELPDKPPPQPPLLRTVNKEKTKLLSILGKSLLLKSKAMVDSQQHLLTAIVAVGLLLFIGWWLIKPSVDPASKKILGTAIASVNTELREGARIIGKLPKGTPLEILHKPGFSNQLVQDPDFFLLVRTKPGDGKPVLSGSVQVRDLENLEIESNKAFTGWHLLWLAMNRFPNAELTDLKDLRQYLEFVNKEIETHPEAAPPFALLKHQAVGYLSLARRSKTPDAAKMGCKGAERYIGKLPAGENQVLTAEYKASCASQPAPAPKPSCTEILKEVREKLNVAGDLYSNDHFGEANKIFQQILKADPCNSEVRAIRQQASEYHTKCLAKLKSSESS